MGKNKHGKKKVYLSNVDVPLSKTDAKVVKSNAPGNETAQPPKSILKPASSQQPSTSADCNKYVVPELFSTLAVCQKIERVKNTQYPLITNAGQLTPNSKKQLNTKITKKLNHQPDTNVYSRLTPVVVNDNLRPPVETRTKYQFTGKKDPEPTLSDYLMPIEPYKIEYAIALPVHTMGKVQADNYPNIIYVMSNLDGEFGLRLN